MIRFTMMPGEDGDCLLLEYGDDSFVRRILVDGGRSGTYPLIKPTLAGLDGLVDLLVVTHVDQDHILGVLALMDDLDRSVEFGDVWFNGFDQLLDTEGFGAVDGEKLTSALPAQKVPWNDAFGGRGVEVGRELAWFDEGSTMDVLSPDRGQLERLAPVWSAECAKNGLMPGRDADELPLTGAPMSTPLDFSYETRPARVVFRPGAAVSATPGEAARLGLRRVLVVCGSRGEATARTPAAAPCTAPGCAVPAWAPPPWACTTSSAMYSAAPSACLTRRPTRWSSRTSSPTTRPPHPGRSAPCRAP